MEDASLRALWTARLVRQFEDADLDLRPAQGSMSVREQVLQICTSYNFLTVVLSDQPIDMSGFRRDFNMATVQDALRSIRQMKGEVAAAAKALPVSAWNELVEPFGPEWRMTRGQTAYLMLEHEAHHRGQLTVYLRSAGKTPPVLYHPVGENEIFEGID